MVSQLGCQLKYYCQRWGSSQGFFFGFLLNLGPFSGGVMGSGHG